jgi:hypothetical protein
MPDVGNNKAVPSTSSLGCLLRVYWMLGGVAVFMFSGLWIAVSSDSAWFCAIDVLFGAGLFSAILARYLDICHFNGTKATGEPATMNDWRRYAILMLVVGCAVWGLAHGVAWCRVG